MKGALPLYSVIVFCTLLCCSNPTSVEPSISFFNGKEIHFSLENDVILLPVTVGGKTIRKIILDTGMPFEGALLFHREYIDSIRERRIRVTVPGAGGGEPSQAIMYDSVDLLVDSVKFSNQSVVVLESEYTQSFKTNGAIGQTLFKSPVMAIDFNRNKITLADSLSLPDSTWTPVPISLNKHNIPFLTIGVAVLPQDSLIPLRVYIDLADDDPLVLLVKPDAKFSLPANMEKKVIGTGLSGDVYGTEGSVEKISIEGHLVSFQRASFPDAGVRSKQGSDAEGIIGCGLLKHFNLIFDYQNNTMYIKPRTI